MTISKKKTKVLFVALCTITLVVASGLAVYIISSNKEDQLSEESNKLMASNNEDPSRRGDEGQAVTAITNNTTRQDRSIKIACEMLSEADKKTLLGEGVTEQRLETPTNMSGVSISSCTYTVNGENLELRIYGYKTDRDATDAADALKTQGAQVTTKGRYNVFIMSGNIAQTTRDNLSNKVVEKL